MKLVLLRLTCAMCGGTGFIPIKRAMLFIGKQQRPTDLRSFILYVPCGYCDALKAQVPR